MKEACQNDFWKKIERTCPGKENCLIRENAFAPEHLKSKSIFYKIPGAVALTNKNSQSDSPTDLASKKRKKEKVV